MAGYNPQFESIGTAFIQHYYNKFDVPDGTVRAQGLQDLYDPENSIMTFEGTQLKGKDQILAKFQGLTFKAIARRITKTDCQPIIDGSIVVTVIGQLKTDDDQPQSYTQTFILRPAGGSYFIANEIFRLVLHDA